MTLSRWTPRRMALLWVAGIAFQIALIAAPWVFAARYAQRELPRIRREVLANEAHMTAAERTDSISRAEQVAAARVAGDFHLRADGETLFAVVGMPSGRPTAQAVADFRASTQRTVVAVVAIQFGAIPLALVGLTLAWYFARRPNGNSSATHRLA
jgi:hypothetical protein